jgi:hypothetical protein
MVLENKNSEPIPIFLNPADETSSSIYRLPVPRYEATNNMGKFSLFIRKSGKDLVQNHK